MSHNLFAGVDGCGEAEAQYVLVSLLKRSVVQSIVDLNVHEECVEELIESWVHNVILLGWVHEAGMRHIS